MRRFVSALLLILSGCGEAVRDDHFTNAAEPVEEPRPDAGALAVPPVPVRVGELGPSFAACNGVGTTRNMSSADGLAVRAAPFDSAAEAGRIEPGRRFFVCTRSHDQRWLGIVWPSEGELDGRCGVSAPLPRRTDYAGPCRSGWVSAASVKLVAG
jgi:hypothetical protein